MAPSSPSTDPAERVARPIHWLALSLLCVFIDYQSGPAIQFPFVYLVPIAMASWYGGRRWGLGLAVVLPLCRFYFHSLWDPPWMTYVEASINAAIRITVFASFAWLIDRTARQMRELKQMHLLEEIVGVCAVCKKIRDERGDSWQSLDRFVAGHPTDFKREVCPECAAQQRDVFERR